MTRGLKVTGLVVAILTVLAGLSFWFLLIPREDPQPLPYNLISLHSDRGEALLRNASALADYDRLTQNFEAQELKSFCGVATGVIVLNALDHPVSQTSLFDGPASSVRPIWKVALGGMTLDTLEGLLDANGVEATVHRPDTASLEEFRGALRRNLGVRGDYLVVNYAREELGQTPLGHISPIAAFDERSDMALVLDTAAYKYPPTWVPVEALFRAMATTDADNGRSRGWLEVEAASGS